MTFILKPKQGDDFVVNAWNWRPIVSLLVREGVIPSGEPAERCLANGSGGALSEKEALEAAKKHRFVDCRNDAESTYSV